MDALRYKLVAGSSDELRLLFQDLLACHAEPTQKTLDLIGHSTTAYSLLTLGHWVIDGEDPEGLTFWRELATDHVLPRLGITAIRLLGCATALGRRGRATMHALAEVLAVPVYGTIDLVTSSCYGPGGFAPERRYLLRSNRQLERRASPEHARQTTQVARAPSPSCPRPGRDTRVATAAQARRILDLLQLDRGAPIVGAHSPNCEISVQASPQQTTEHLEILWEGRLVCVRSHGSGSRAIAYPVSDHHALVRLVDRLPARARDPRTRSGPP